MTIDELRLTNYGRVALAAGVLIALLIPGCATKEPEKPAPAAAGTEQPVPQPAPTIDARPVIVALGDSLTAGLGVEPEDTYPAQLQRKIDEGGYRYRVINAGVSGDTSAQGLNRLGTVRELQPVIVIVALGANDGLRGLPAEATRDNLDAIIRAVQEDGSKVVLAGMEIPPNYGSAYTRAFRSIYPELARQYKVALIPFLLQGVGGHAELNQGDGIHPTAEGYRIVVENVWKILKPLLTRIS